MRVNLHHTKGAWKVLCKRFVKQELYFISVWPATVPLPYAKTVQPVRPAVHCFLPSLPFPLSCTDQRTLRLLGECLWTNWSFHPAGEQVDVLLLTYFKECVVDARCSTLYCPRQVSVRLHILGLMKRRSGELEESPKM